MSGNGFPTRIHNYYKRKAASLVFRNQMAIRPQQPVISFTFDDFPRSALLNGGTILKRHGVRGTYYTALSLLGSEGPSGPLFVLEDLQVLRQEGHELGCHTFAHCHSWDTDADDFELSVLRNRTELNRLIPGVLFESLSYPISEPRPLTKRRVARHFLCARGGGQTFNAGSSDLNQLSAYFLEKSRGDIGTVKRLIDKNRSEHGWLIFATHDVVQNPSPFGCSPDFFEEVVQYAVNSDACILPVVKALKNLHPPSLSAVDGVQ